jgi:Peptidase family M23
MAWFSLWLPLLLQLLLPIVLLIGLAHLTSSRVTSAAGALLVAAYILAIATAGLWLVLPWYAPTIYGAAWLGVIARSWPRLTSAPVWPTLRLEQAVTTIAIAGSIALLGLVAGAWSARRAPADVVDVTMPVREGTYLVVNGGGHVLVNAHLNTLSGERFAPYRGQSHGVDLVRINRAGLRASGLLPADPGAYVIYGDPVLAPCAGRVVFAEDGAADMPPPQADRAHMAGNHVILECGAVWIVLGHLQRGSVAVRVGQITEPGHVLGLVGNSGNSGEPHLHVHAQRPGSTLAPLSGEPVPIRLGGRYLVRNDRVQANRDGPS